MDRKSDLLVRHVDLLRAAFRSVRRARPFNIDAICVLPEHLHAVWTLPAADADYPDRWNSLKALFTRLCLRRELEITHNAKGEYHLWQRRYWEHTIADDTDFTRHVDYLHYNPVKHGLVRCVADWPYFSFHRDVRLGWLPRNWAGADGNDDRRPMAKIVGTIVASVDRGTRVPPHE